MTTINVGDTVRHDTRPHVTGTVTAVAQLRNRVGVYITGQRGAYNPDDLIVITTNRPRFKPGDRVRRLSTANNMPANSIWTVNSVTELGSLRLEGDDQKYFRDASLFEMVAELRPEPGTSEGVLQQARQAATVDEPAPLPVEAPLVRDDGWWTIEGESDLLPEDSSAWASSFGLEVRVQVSKARP